MSATLYLILKVCTYMHISIHGSKYLRIHRTTNLYNLGFNDD